MGLIVPMLVAIEETSRGGVGHVVGPIPGVDDLRVVAAVVVAGALGGEGHH